MFRFPEFIRAPVFGLAAVAAAMALSTSPALGATFLETVHTDGSSGFAGSLDHNHAFAVQWTQTASLTDVRLHFVVVQRTLSNPAARWTLGSALGGAATAADVIATGQVNNVRPFAVSSVFDFGQHTLDVGIPGTLGPGTYSFVLDAPTSLAARNSVWIGALAGDVGVDAQLGFTLDGFYSSDGPGAFGLDGGFSGWSTDGRRFAFAVEGDLVPSAPPPAVPEPSSWALMLVGVGLAGASLRARRRRVAP
jgi:hypothetical protein